MEIFYSLTTTCYNSFLSRNKKNGAPTAAITIPTGNSIGAKIIRANVSLIVTVAIPKKIVAGNK